jgi:hypothetical protein
MTGKNMKTDVITPPATVPRSFGIPNPYSFIFTAGGSSNNED